MKQAKADPQTVANATPVCGAWQLQFWVNNFAPAVQKIVAEQLQPDGSWRELASRYTIEFRAKAARPHSKIRREFTVPVDSPEAKLRIAVRGVGQVALSHIALTNGVMTHRSIDWSQKKTIGSTAPAKGFPELDGFCKAQVLEVKLPNQPVENSTNGRGQMPAGGSVS